MIMIPGLLLGEDPGRYEVRHQYMSPADFTRAHQTEVSLSLQEETGET